MTLRSPFPVGPTSRTIWRDAVSVPHPAGLRPWLALFVFAHIALGPLMYYSRPFATLHAFLAIGTGLWWAITRPTLDRVAYAAAYIVGSEVLWRMCNANIFWESGKYAVVAVFFVALFRQSRGVRQVRLLPLWYFGLLLPSAILTFLDMPFAEAQETISFNLSGPVALMMSALFFSQVSLTQGQRRRLFLMIAAPALSIATVALSVMMTNPDLTFGLYSNASTSGNFGPNQVSAALGLAALGTFFCLIDGEQNKRFRILMATLTLFLVTQSALTFSRGGLYTSAGAAVLGLAFMVRDPRARRRIAFAALVLVPAVSYIVLPRLDEFTSGTLTARFADTGLTDRDKIAADELAIWLDHPVLGIGPGRSNFFRPSSSKFVAAHTEFSRMLAEHGVFGLASMLILLILAFTSVRQQRAPEAQALAISCLAWGILFMLNAGMRVAAPSFMFGLASAGFLMNRRSQAPRDALRTRRAGGSPRRIQQPERPLRVSA